MEFTNNFGKKKFRHNPIQQKLSQALIKYISYLLVAKDKAIMVALHYFKAKKISSVPSKALKDNCKCFCIPYEMISSKIDLLRSLGQRLYEENIVQIKNDSEVITHYNLITIAKESSVREN